MCLSVGGKGFSVLMTDTLPEVKTRIGALWSLANISTLVGLLGLVVVRRLARR